MEADTIDGAVRSFAFGISLASAVGPIALLILGYGIRGGLRPAAAAGAPSRPFVTTYILTLVNPLTVVIFATFAGQLPLSTPRTAVVFAVSLFLGSLMIQMMFAAGGATLSRLVSRPGWIRTLNVASGVAIALFGMAALIERAG